MSANAHLSGPAFAHIPPWVLPKLRPMAIEKIQAVFDWVENECIPREHIMEAQLEGNKWARPPVMLELRAKAKEKGLFNLFLPHHFKESPGLTHLEYACCAEILGRCYWASETVNSHAPESGNIELLAKFCNDKQKEKWLRPLMEGTASSAYSMTEPDVAASDATNVGIRITKDGDEYVINGRKIYGNCMWNKGLAFYIMMGCSDPENPNPWERHSTVIVPADTPGFTQVRNLNVLGYSWAPEGHGEYTLENVRIPAENVILGPGKGFAIAQGRLGPGRIHHCLRLLGQCERAIELAIMRCNDARFKPRGKLIGEFDSNIERVAQMRLELDAMRQITYNATETLDFYAHDDKMLKSAGKKSIAQAKILVPATVEKIINECMQLWGGQGVTNEHSPMPKLWAYARFVRLADGPDAAHRHQVGRDEMKKAGEITERHKKYNALAASFAEQYGEKIITMPEDSL
ncbi:hypothetical protein V2G26_008090 [Clonostachys chloroleuca]|uniref:Uncharacterized protein n=1 Tax=Clonostachys chloroleuca TaxID=1926264 RepID=A0AA35M1A9_9HYPO|nr:unnamed protein product [Clonostachys chloroleuca]